MMSGPKNACKYNNHRMCEGLIRLQHNRLEEKSLRNFMLTMCTMNKFKCVFNYFNYESSYRYFRRYITPQWNFIQTISSRTGQCTVRPCRILSIHRIIIYVVIYIMCKHRCKLSLLRHKKTVKNNNNSRKRFRIVFHN